MGAGLPDMGSVFFWRAQAYDTDLSDSGTRQAIVEYTSCLLVYPHDAFVLRMRSMDYEMVGEYRQAFHDAETALIYEGDPIYYYYMVGETTGSIAYLREAWRMACSRHDRQLMEESGRMLLLFEPRYPYTAKDAVFP
jgi:hypothetical protein